MGALVLTRKANEGVTLTVPPSEKDTVIHVTNVRNDTSRNQVRLAFEAPKQVNIVRDELIGRPEKGAA